MRERRRFLADSSSLIALDRTGRIANVRGGRLLIPRAVKKEIVDDALLIDSDAPAYSEALASASRFLYHIERGDIQILDIDYSEYGSIIDRARKRLAKLEGSTEDETPKADAEMAAAIAQLLADGRTFGVLCDDRTLVEGILKRMFPKVSFLRSDDLFE